MNCTKVVIGQHAYSRMFGDGVDPESVARAVKSGEIVEEYAEERPFPQYLLLHIEQEKALHLIVGNDEQNGICYVMTVYRPDRRLWNDDFKRRRQR